jgi:hypothetical protein
MFFACFLFIAPPPPPPPHDVARFFRLLHLPRRRLYALPGLFYARLFQNVTLGTAALNFPQNNFPQKRSVA